MNFSQYSGKRPARYKFDRHATFIIDDKGNRTIRFRVNKNGIKFDTNLVVTGDMTADKAKVANWNLDISRGIDPRPKKRENLNKPSFRYCMDEYLKKKLTDLTNDKNKKQWRSTLETHICPSIGNKSIDEITSSDIIEAIRPLWDTRRGAFHLLPSLPYRSTNKGKLRAEAASQTMAVPAAKTAALHSKVRASAAARGCARLHGVAS